MILLLSSTFELMLMSPTHKVVLTEIMLQLSVHHCLQVQGHPLFLLIKHFIYFSAMYKVKQSGFSFRYYNV